MLKLIMYIVFLIAGMVMEAQTTVEVTLTKLNSDEGTVQVGLYNEAGEFLNKTFKSASSEIVDRQATVVFEDVPAGEYAISSYHDADGNGKMKMFMGMIPSEPYACSMGAKGFFGPPKWDDAVFEVVEGEAKEIEVRF